MGQAPEHPIDRDASVGPTLAHPTVWALVISTDLVDPALDTRGSDAVTFMVKFDGNVSTTLLTAVIDWFDGVTWWPVNAESVGADGMAPQVTYTPTLTVGAGSSLFVVRSPVIGRQMRMTVTVDLEPGAGYSASSFVRRD